MTVGIFYRMLIITGFLSLFHSAYSAAQHRSYLRLNELDFIALPLDISIQAILSLFVIVYSVLQMSGNFKEIKASAELDNKSWGTFKNLPSFYIFGHRGKSFSPYVVLQNQQQHMDVD
ncbi:ER membrane protein complex subunit 5 [Coccinella septempunctata]|uniref:ER membrane protein complex subunit 5 n=1 Tax=Coccinella septempunctata TaxID=41139 RepID=UPI001D0890E6|nr:ER membrane protein complex subunit 5 [Coccinella septempunctata]